MAILHHHNDQLAHHENSSSFLDALYCDEERWEEEEVEQVEGNNETGFLLPRILSEQDLFWEDEELNSLFSKEEEACFDLDVDLSLARREAIEWMLKVHAHYGFSALTATLAINYLDRFLSSFHFQREKPWMIQLVAVACLSLAAKVEETQVPLLLDLQVEDTKCMFEAKTIQRMELLVLSALKWKMHPVTPLSFLDHIIRRLGLKTHLHWEFLRRCEHLLLSILPDSRFVGYLPSVLATATMLRVVDQIEQSEGMEYKNQLLGVLKSNKEKVDECYNAIQEMSKGNNYYNYGHNKTKKRRYEEISPESPSGVIDAVFGSDGSNDSWAVGSSLCSSPEPLFKKTRPQEQQQQMTLSPFNRVIVGIVGASP
ncbi:cyclin-D3-1-like [Neltuma alba]|uniref:cyclin-D3-1 n=1 Tax=Neltuma alba TaxID=207710 RepID=UPI0010A3CA62|nr:cyclin-D3-1-like [Prosopis alba]XP_028767663.1 cyclin-D3-1-like [Prosopis alba]